MLSEARFSLADGLVWVAYGFVVLEATAFRRRARECRVDAVAIMAIIISYV